MASSPRLVKASGPRLLSESSYNPSAALLEPSAIISLVTSSNLSAGVRQTLMTSRLARHALIAQSGSRRQSLLQLHQSQAGFLQATDLLAVTCIPQLQSRLVLLTSAPWSSLQSAQACLPALQLPQPRLLTVPRRLNQCDQLSRSRGTLHRRRCCLSLPAVLHRLPPPLFLHHSRLLVYTSNQVLQAPQAGSSQLCRRPGRQALTRLMRCLKQAAVSHSLHQKEALLR